jgi:quercetin dioxygenase-like cupin family protein
MSERHFDPVGRQEFAFERHTDDDGTPVTVAHCWVRPTGGVPPHIHPTFTEIFEVVEGEITFTAGRKKEVRRAGESITVPAGTRHAYANKGDTDAYMKCTARPGLDLEEFLTTTARLGREGHIFRIGPVRGAKGFRGLCEVGAMLRRHRPNTVILNPPPLVQRLVLDRLADRAESA